MTVESYKTLYEGSVVFGVRKHCHAGRGMPQLEAKLQEITHKRNVLRNKVINIIFRSLFQQIILRKSSLRIN